jgi:hypothetical protein
MTLPTTFDKDGMIWCHGCGKVRHGGDGRYHSLCGCEHQGFLTADVSAPASESEQALPTSDETTAPDMTAYNAELEVVRNRHALWEVKYGGPEESTSVGLFVSRDDALLVYRATRLTQWHSHADVRVFRMGEELPTVDDGEGWDGGCYCQIGSLYWVTLQPVLVIPATLPRRSNE